jgi:hypothetical protein
VDHQLAAAAELRGARALSSGALGRRSGVYDENERCDERCAGVVMADAQPDQRLWPTCWQRSAGAVSPGLMQPPTRPADAFATTDTDADADADTARWTDLREGGGVPLRQQRVDAARLEDRRRAKVLLRRAERHLALIGSL